MMIFKKKQISRYNLLMNTFCKDIVNIILEYTAPSIHIRRKRHSELIQHINILDCMNEVRGDLTVDNDIKKCRYDKRVLKHRGSTNYDETLHMMRRGMIPKDKFGPIIMAMNRRNFKGSIIICGNKSKNIREWRTYIDLDQYNAEILRSYEKYFKEIKAINYKKPHVSADRIKALNTTICQGIKTSQVKRDRGYLMANQLEAATQYKYISVVSLEKYTKQFHDQYNKCIYVETTGVTFVNERPWLFRS